MQTLAKILSIALLLILFSCSKEESPLPNEPNNPLSEEELMQQIDQIFPFTPNQNFNALYHCARLNSVLDWYWLFNEDGSFDVLFTTDTHENFSFKGNYTYANEQITLQMNGGPTMPFPNGFKRVYRGSHAPIWPGCCICHTQYGLRL